VKTVGLTPTALGLLAALLAAIAMALSLRPAGWDLTALPRVNAGTALGAAARTIDQNFHAVHTGAYDGQFYWGIAIDPLATNTVHPTFDKPSYRYGHPLYGWLGWIFSGGVAQAVPAALAGIGLASMFAAAAAASALGMSRGSRGWEGLAVALNPGLIVSARGDLSEPLGVALLLGALAAYQRERRAAAWICFALLPLAKEPLILVPLSVVVWELVQRKRWHAFVLATAIAPALAWWTYARIHFGQWFTSGGSALAAPFTGWSRSIDRDRSAVGDLHHSPLAAAALVAILIVVVLTGVRALRARGPVELTAIAFAMLGLCLAANATGEVTTAWRNTAFLFALAPFVLGGRALTGPDPRRRGQARAENASATSS
jgi:hypothetical protein